MPTPLFLALQLSCTASYGAVFADEPEIRAIATDQSCVASMPTRGHVHQTYAGRLRLAGHDLTMNSSRASMASTAETRRRYLYDLWIRVSCFTSVRTATDWDALAELPQKPKKSCSIITLTIADGETIRAVRPTTIIGILMTIRPPALGGKQDEAFGRSLIRRLSSVAWSGSQSQARDSPERLSQECSMTRELNDRACVLKY